MKPYNLHLGNCLDVLKTLEDNSVDSIVTDPPYGLSFMGKKWDYDVPSVEIWNECLRVLKPGGHLLAFAGTRTQHRMAVNIEDAGFEIRDMVSYLYSTTDTMRHLIETMTPEQLKLLDATLGRDAMMGWGFGSGFPKSLDVSKAIDKAAGVEGKVVGERRFGKTSTGQNSDWNTNHVAATGRQEIRAPATEAAQQWQGWGTALKPALEPITVARKPFKGTVADNVLTHGTGAINVDGCRVGADAEVIQRGSLDATFTNSAEGYTRANRSMMTHKPKERSGPASEQGRWPANFIHDGSDEVVDLFPQTKSSAGKKQTPSKNTNAFGDYGATDKIVGHNDNGSAARYFYCAKASKKDRDEGCEAMEERSAPHGNHEGRDMSNPKNHLGGMQGTKSRNHHPTVKPTDLMRYLVRLVTPPNGTVLDPFMGSGSTGKACMLEGFKFIGVDMEQEYLDIAQARIENVCQSEEEQEINDEIFKYDE